MKKGDFVEIDFVGRIASTGEIFDLTLEDVAKKEGVFDEKAVYKPHLVIIGSGSVVPGVEEELKKMKPGEEREFTVKFKDAFGPRRFDQIKIISLAKFTKKNIHPVPGEYYELDGRRARVQSVSGGRVRVDFNHPLAGKDLRYKIKIVREIKEPIDKVKALLRHNGIEAETSLSEGTLTIKTKEPLHPLIEKMFDETIRKWISEIKKVVFESENKPKPAADTTAKESKTQKNSKQTNA